MTAKKPGPKPKVATVTAPKTEIALPRVPDAEDDFPKVQEALKTTWEVILDLNHPARPNTSYLVRVFDVVLQEWHLRGVYPSETRAVERARELHRDGHYKVQVVKSGV